MPSYKVLPTEEERYNPDLLRDGLGDEVGYESSLDPPRGVIADSFEGDIEDEIFWVKFGWERTGTRLTWEGEDQYSYIESYPVFFLQNGYIAHHKGRTDVRSSIRSAIQRVIQSGITLDHIEFHTDDLLDVLDQAESVQRLDIAPTDRSEPDYLSASDRDDLRKTNFVEEYEGEPFQKVKISVPGEDVDVNVGFDQDGTVILYGRNMELPKQASVLRFLCNEVIENYVGDLPNQGNLSRFI